MGKVLRQHPGTLQLPIEAAKSIATSGHLHSTHPSADLTFKIQQTQCHGQTNRFDGLSG
jgi:hypothetical protein